MIGVLSKLSSIFGIASVIRLLTRATPKKVPLNQTNRLGPNVKNGYRTTSPSTIKTVAGAGIIGGLAVFLTENKDLIMLGAAGFGIISLFFKDKGKK